MIKSIGCGDTPIGLDIGAQTPAEIGVAIIGEIIEVKNRKKRTYGYSKEIMRALITRRTISGTKSDGNDCYQTRIGTTGTGYEDADIPGWTMCGDNRWWLYGNKSHSDCQTDGSRGE